MVISFMFYGLSTIASHLKYQSFVCAHLNNQTVLFQTIQFSRIILFALSLNVKELYLIHR